METNGTEKSFCRCASLMLTGILLVSSASSGEMNLGDLLLAMEYNSSRLSSFQCDYTGDSVMEHIVEPSTVGSGRDFSVARLRKLSTEEQANRTESLAARWIQQEEAWRVDYTINEWAITDIPAWSGKAAFDGVFFRAWQSNTNSGVIKGPDATLPPNLITPARAMCNPEMLRMLNSEHTRLAGVENVGESQCYRLEYDPGRRGLALTVWVDPRRGFGIIRMQEALSGHPVILRQIDVTEFRDFGEGVWIPTEAVVTSHWQLGPDAGNVSSRARLSIDPDSVVVNELIDNELFRLKFPEGSSVWNAVTDEGYVEGELLTKAQLDYTVRRVVEMLPEAELEGGEGVSSDTHMDPRPSASTIGEEPRTRPHTAGWWYMLVAVLAVIGLTGFISIRRLRRRMALEEEGQ